VPPGLPDEIGGGVCVIERQIEPCSFPDVARYDDLMGGVRVSQPLHGVGTLGALVEDVNTGETPGLSCYHVVGDPARMLFTSRLSLRLWWVSRRRQPTRSLWSYGPSFRRPRPCRGTQYWSA
jgi:hypothetical protein